MHVYIHWIFDRTQNDRHSTRWLCALRKKKRRWRKESMGMRSAKDFPHVLGWEPKSGRTRLTTWQSRFPSDKVTGSCFPGSGWQATPSLQLDRRLLPLAWSRWPIITPRTGMNGNECSTRIRALWQTWYEKELLKSSHVPVLDTGFVNEAATMDKIEMQRKH